MTANSAFLGTLYAQIAVNTTALDHAAVKMQQFAARAEVAMLRVQKSMMAAGAAMKTFGRSMTQFVTLPMALVGGAALKMYADFEFSMNKVVSLVGVAREQVDEWAKAILALAPSVGKSPRELADAMYFITSAGIRGTEAMEILEESAKSSASGLGEVKVIADLLTSAMNAYGKENLSAARANDILVATVREGKAEAALLAQSLGLVLPIASAMGASFDQVGAATAAMTRTGTKAATAAIQLRQMFNSLLKPAKEAEQALHDMGTSSSELRRIIREEGLMAALIELDSITKEYGINAVGKVIPNIRSLTGFLDIMGKNFKANAKLTDAIRDSVGDANRTFKETADTIKFRMNVAFTRVTTSATIFGESLSKVLVPTIEKLATFIEKLVRRFDALSESQKKWIVRIGGAIAVLGPFLTILGFLVGNILPGLIMAVRGVASAFAFMSKVIMTNPIGFLITAVTTLVSLYMIWRNRTREVADAQMTLSDAVDAATKSVVSERNAVNQLFKIAQDVTKTEEERGEAIKILNRLSPEYLGNLNMQNIMEATALTVKKAYIAELVREAKVRAVMAEMNRLEIDYLEQVTNKGAAVLTFWQKLAKFASAGGMGVEEHIAFVKAMEDVNLARTTAEFDAARKSLQDMLEVIIEAEDLGSVLGGGGEDDPAAGLLTIAGVLKSYTDEVEFAKNMQIAYGDSFDYVTHMLGVSQSAVEGYIRAGMDPLNEEIVTLVGNIRELELALSMRELKDFADGLAEIEKEIVKMQDLEFESMTTDVFIDMQAAVLGLDQEIKQLISDWNGLGEASKTVLEWSGMLKSTFNGMQNVVSRSLKETENVLQAFGKFFAEFIKGMIIKLVAATIAAAALAIVLALLPGGSITKVFSTLDDAASMGDLFKAGFKTFTGMQHGGTVPPGYPNDSFPALLTSGEKVLPARRSRNDMMGGEVVFRIEGTELVGILKKQMSLEENF